jgi:drug/metabolite transporter (DMT)-like permease
MTRTDVRRAVAAVGALVVVQVSVGTTYRASQAAGRVYTFSTLSSIALAEVLKLVLAVILHYATDASADGKASSFLGSLRHSRTETVALLLALSVGYALNNQMFFRLVQMADPGTVFLLKACGVVFVAVLERLIFGKRKTRNEWVALGHEMLGMIVMQYDDCANRPDYNPLVYALICVSCVLTALCTTVNANLVKTSTLPLHVQNGLLYIGGFTINCLLFVFLEEKSFFEGYDNFPALLILLLNSSIGLIISFVYRYADAIAKMIATDISAIILIAISAVFFGYEVRVRTVAGMTITFLAMWNYSVANLPSTPGKVEDPPRPGKSPSPKRSPRPIRSKKD